MAFITLTTSDSGDKFYVRVDAVSAMYRTSANDIPYTSMFFTDSTGVAHWSVRETPEEIMALIEALSGEYSRIPPPFKE